MPPTYLIQTDYNTLILAMQYRITMLQNLMANSTMAQALAAFADLQTEFQTMNGTVVSQYQTILAKLEALQVAAPTS